MRGPPPPPEEDPEPCGLAATIFFRKSNSGAPAADDFLGDGFGPARCLPEPFGDKLGPWRVAGPAANCRAAGFSLTGRIARFNHAGE